MRFLTDIYPAKAEITSKEGKNHEIGTVRAILTQTDLILATDSPEGPKIILLEPYESFSKAKGRKTPNTVTLKSGNTVVFSKDDECGCGSRLKSWNAYKTLYEREQNLAN
jgi:hypothetical protein